MGHAAMSTDPDVRRPASEETNAHEKLVKALLCQTVDLAREHKGLPAETMKAATELAYLLIGSSAPKPPTLSLGASEDGDEVLISIFGNGGRQADVWVKDASYAFSFVAVTGDKIVEKGALKFAEASKLTEWLSERASKVS